MSNIKRRKYSRFSKTREIALRKANAVYHGASFIKRSGIVQRRIVPTKTKAGYEFLKPGRSPYTYQDLLDIKHTALVMKNSKTVQKLRKALVIQEHGVMPLDKAISSMFPENSQTESELIEVTNDYQYCKDFDKLAGEKAVRHRTTCQYCLSGPMAIGPAILQGFTDQIFGFALCRTLLDVPLWYETNLDTDIDYYMNMECLNHLQRLAEDGEEIEAFNPEDIDNWRLFDFEFEGSYNDPSVYSVKELVKNEEEWDQATALAYEAFAKILKDIPVQEINTLLQEKPLDDRSIWLRCVIWLCLQKFDFMEFATLTDEEMMEYGGVPTSDSCGLFWNYDSYMDVYDLFNNAYRNSGGWGSLGFDRLMLQNHIVQPDVKEPIKAMEVFTIMSGFNFYHNKFTDGTNERLHSLVPVNSILGWERILHRRIKSAQKWTTERGEAHRRRLRNNADKALQNRKGKS